MHCSGHFKPILVYKGDRFQKKFRQSGNDRDEYVANNNGGFSIGHQPAQQIKPGTTYIANGKPRPFNSLGIDKTVRNNVRAHMVMYRQNGTGRDTYILNNNGGFAIHEGSNKFVGYQQDFKRSLRNYPPAEPRMGKSFTSVSPVRYRSNAGFLGSTLNRFKVYNNRQRCETPNVDDVDLCEKGSAIKPPDDERAELIDGQAKSRTQKMGHYRTQSLQVNQEAIKQYLKQRQAYHKAQQLNESLSVNSVGSKDKSRSRSRSQSAGRLFENKRERDRSQSNPKPRTSIVH